MILSQIVTVCEPLSTTGRVTWYVWESTTCTELLSVGVKVPSVGLGADDGDKLTEAPVTPSWYDQPLLTVTLLLGRVPVYFISWLNVTEIVSPEPAVAAVLPVALSTQSLVA